MGVSHKVVSDSLQPHGPQPARLLCPWGSPGKSTGVGCRFLPQGIFRTQGCNLGLLHCRQILYHLKEGGGVGGKWGIKPASLPSPTPNLLGTSNKPQGQSLEQQ